MLVQYLFICFYYLIHQKKKHFNIIVGKIYLWIYNHLKKITHYDLFSYYIIMYLLFIFSSVISVK